MNNYTILAVNDTPAQLELMAFIMGEAGYRVLTACNGVEGLKAAQHELPDLIISDVMMPEMDGIEFCRLIRADNKLCLIPVLLVSAIRKDTESIVQGFEAGADDYMEAPYEPMRLVAKTAQLIERKRMDDALRESENRLRTIFDNAAIGIAMVNSEGRSIQSNPALQQMLGYTDEELQQTSFTEITHPDDVTKGTALIREVFDGKLDYYQMEKRYIKKSGDVMWGHLTVSAIRSSPDSGTRVAVGMVEDITERKLADVALRESEERFKAQYKNIPIPTYTWRRVGDDFIFVDYNDEADKINRKQISKFIGIKASKLYCDKPEVLENVNRCFDEKIVVQHETSYRFKTTGELKQMDITYVFVPPDIVMVHARDITEQLQAEESLRKSEERFQLASLATEDAFWDWDVTTNSVWYSESYYKLFGRSPEEGESNFDLWQQAIHPDDKDRVINGINTVIENGERFWVDEYRLCSADGSCAYIFDRGYVVYDNDGKPVRMIGAAINFTARKETESTLHFQKTLLEAQCEASIDGILVVKPTGEILSHNRRFVEMWEISKNVLATKSDEKLLEAVIDKLVDPQEFSETVSYLYQNPFIKDQAEISLKDGRIFERYTAPVIDADYTHFGRVWFFRDITKRKQTEDAIRFQAHLLDTVEQAVIAVDLDGIVTYWNRFAQKLYGWTAAEAVGLSIMKLMTPEISLKEGAKIRSQLRTSKSWAGEFIMQTKNGTTFPAQVFNSPVNDDKGKLIGIVGISINITERKEAETALVEANNRAISEYVRLLEKLATLGQKLGSARDLSAVFSAILEFANASVPCSALLISLYDKKQRTRKGIYMWYNGDETDISALETLPVGDGFVGQAIKSGEVTIVNDYLMEKQPTYVYLGFDEDSREPRSTIIAPMKIMGNVIGVIEVQSYESAAYAQEHATAMQMAANLAANAIENVRLLEQERINAEQLRLSQKLESVGRLAGGIAHDFNNMLTAINGYSDLTLRRLKDGDPLRANIEEIKKAGERSALLTHQLLAFSRKQVLKPKVLDVNQVITEVSTMLKRLIGEDIHLITILAPKLGMVEADPGQLTQVVINLAVNARDAMTQGGELTIETNNVYLDEGYVAHHINMRSGSYIQLLVRDSGTGMTGETQEHIFEPFYTTKEIGKGTGLGLATVYGIIKQSGGYIWVYSEIGKGSAFKIYLPRVDEEEVILSEENAEPEHTSKGTETILLVEDEEIVRNLSRQILETCDYKVIEASDGIEALSICQQPDCKIDLLLTDVVMPEMSGRQLVEHLAALRPEIKVLYMSGYTDDAIVRQGVIQTGSNFIQKPFTFNTLTRKIRELLDAKNGLRNS